VTDTDPERGDRRRVASQLRADIEHGKYRPGTKLPSYRQLEDSYGVARNTVAAALRVLQGEGLVDIRPNSGAYVRDPNAPRARDIRTELLDLQEQLHKTRRELADAQKRVTGLLEAVPIGESDR
jgi:DNA-binding FadR family transcriptional regulator